VQNNSIDTFYRKFKSNSKDLLTALGRRGGVPELDVYDQGPPRVRSPFRSGRIEYVSDPDSYADWSFYTPGGASQARQVEEYRSDKVAAQSLNSLYFPVVLLFRFSCFCAFLVHI